MFDTGRTEYPYLFAECAAFGGDSSVDVTIYVTVENTGDAEGTQEVEVTLGDQIIKSKTTILEAGEERTLSYNYTVEQSGRAH